MSTLLVSDLIKMVQRHYVLGGLATAKTHRYQSRPVCRDLGDVQADSLTWDMIEDYKAKRVVDEGRARATVNRELNGLSKGYSLAIEAGLLPEAARPKIQLFRLRNARQGFVYPEQFVRIWKRLPHLVQDIAAVAYWTGWRLGEVTGLTWDRVEVVWMRVRDKNGDPKSASILGPIEAAIERRRSYRIDGCSLVFHRSGEHVLTFRKAWNYAVRDAGIGRHVIFHDLRRSFINNGRRANIDRKILMQMTGHKTHSVFDRYQFVDEDEQEDAARKIIERNNPGSEDRCA